MDPTVEDVEGSNYEDEYADDNFEDEGNGGSNLDSASTGPLSRDDRSSKKANNPSGANVSKDMPSRLESKVAESDTAGEGDAFDAASNSPLHLRQKQLDVDEGLPSSDATKRLVEQGEKYVKLAQDINAKRDELVQARQELAQFRSLLLNGIIGDTDNVEDYLHVPLGELLRIRLQAVENSGNENNITSPSRSTEDAGGVKASDHEKSILEEKLVKMRRQIIMLQTRYNDMKSRADESVKLELDVDRLNKKIVHMVERSRYERDIRGKAESRVCITEKKVEVLSDHIERLMAYLKSEATAKVRLVKSRIRLQREVELLRKRDEVLTKKINCKDRYIEDMKGSVKVLEDQLRLMDEKYMELRLKLDWSRAYTEKVVKKRDEEIQQLQDQLTLARNVRLEITTVG